MKYTLKEIARMEIADPRNSVNVKKMTTKEACELVNTLKKENETNSPEEREFNNEWLRLIYKVWGDAIDKVYSKSQAKDIIAAKPDVPCRAFRTWLKKVKKEQQHYKLFKGVVLNENDLFGLWSADYSPVDALNELSTVC